MRIFATIVSVLAALATGAVAGCDLPRDSDGTMERLRAGGELRVGIVANPPWVRVVEGGAEGIEPALIRAWAERLGARVRWIPGDLDSQVRALEKHEIDVLLAGFTSRTPYESRIGVSRPYLRSRDRIAALDEKARRGLARGSRVVAAAPGESALLMALDRYLLGLGEARISEIARGQAPESAP